MLLLCCVVVVIVSVIAVSVIAVAVVLAADFPAALLQGGASECVGACVERKARITACAGRG